MNKNRIKIVAITISLMFCSYVTVQQALNHKEIRASEIVKDKILSNEASIIMDNKTRHVVISGEKTYRPCSRLVILCDKFIADTARIEGEGEYKNQDVKFVIYGNLDSTQKLIIDGKHSGEGAYLEKVGEIVKLNLGNSDLKITKARCILTGKSTDIE